MKKIVFSSVVASVLLWACNKPAQAEANNENTPEDTSVVAQERPTGGDQDEHGCNPSTGETWSNLKQTCLRLFDDALRLNPIEQKEGEAVISAFVVFNDDKSKVEVFLTNDNKILDKTSENTFADEHYKYDAAEKALYIEGVKKYIAEN